MDRRQFLGAAATVAAAAMLPARSIAADAKPAIAAADKLVLGVPVTHSDWMLKPNVPWGEAGVRQMLDACKAAGWSQIYWRAFDAGQSTYPSKLLKPASHPEADNIFSPGTDEGKAANARLMPGLTLERGKQILEQLKVIDYGKFDSLKSAVAYGHQIGLKVHAWVTVNEDDHGWGWASEFSKAHPEYRWVRRNGKPYHSQLSFGFPEVRKYKLELLKELLDGYDLDGLFVDWIRTGDIRDDPQNDPAGIADYGYDKPTADAFTAKHGVAPADVKPDDDRWVRARAEPQTIFMRSVRELARAKRKDFPVAVMVGHPWHYRGPIDRIDGNLKGLLLDVETWAKEGLADAYVAAGYYRDGGNAEKAYRALQKETGGKADVWVFGWVPQNVGEFDRDAVLAKTVGAGQILYWEGDYIADRANAAELKAAMAARAKM